MKRILRLVLITAIIITTQQLLSCSQDVEKANEDQQTQIQNPIGQEERREFDRFKIKSLVHPVNIKTQDERVEGLIDISRGGVALSHKNTLTKGDIIPLEITYKEVSIEAEVMVVNTTETRAGAQYINPYSQITNQLLYLSVLLEVDNNLLKTKLSG